MLMFQIQKPVELPKLIASAKPITRRNNDIFQDKEFCILKIVSRFCAVRFSHQLSKYDISV